MLGLQRYQTMLDQRAPAYPALVRNVVPKPVPLTLLTDILRRLVEEGVSIRPLREILESLAVHAANDRDPVVLTEFVRSGLKRQITNAYLIDGTLSVYMLDPAIEETVRDSIQRTTAGAFLALQPDIAKDIVGRVKRAVAGAEQPLLLTQADVRRFVRRLIEIEVPNATVLSYQELSADIKLRPIAQITI
ncbi:MAG: FHIPEP family type III secretion protein [Polyangiales bacterium]